MSLFARMRLLIAAGAILVTAASFAKPAEAATAIYHSAQENAYGWCAGYAPARARSCALEQCKKQNGKECVLVAECTGWGAVAYAQDPARGFGAACVGNVQSARHAALVMCASHSNTICWTNIAFSPNGRAQSAQSNRAFDRLWYSQFLLTERGLYSGRFDAQDGPRTRAAVSAMQARLGMEETGRIDDALLQGLIDAQMGLRGLAAAIRTSLLPAAVAELPTSRIHGAATEPASDITFNAVLEQGGEPYRRRALASFVAALGHPCPVPARAAGFLPGYEINVSGEDHVLDAWAVICENEGRYLVEFMGYERARIVSMFRGWEPIAGQD